MNCKSPLFVFTLVIGFALAAVVSAAPHPITQHVYPEDVIGDDRVVQLYDDFASDDGSGGPYDFADGNKAYPYGQAAYGDGWSMNGAQHWLRLRNDLDPAGDGVTNVMQASASSGNLGGPYYQPSPGPTTDGNTVEGDPWGDDYTVTSRLITPNDIMQPSTSLHQAIYARLSPHTDDHSEYYRARFSQGNMYLDKCYWDGAQLVTETLGSKSLDTYGLNWSENEWWTASLSVEGDQITASMWDYQGTGPMNISATDNSVTGGIPGLGGTKGTGQLYWKDFTVHVPEPSTLVLLGLGGLLLMKRRRL